MPLQGAIVVCYGWGEDDDQFWWSGRGAIAGCHCSVLWLEGRVTANFGEWMKCHCWVPLQGAIVVCYAAGKGRAGRVWGSGAIAAIVVCCGWGGGRRPYLGEWTWCHCWVPIHSNGIQTNCLEFLADVTLFSMLITQKLVFAIWGLCW